MTRPTPLSPVFRPDLSRGAIDRGAQVGGAAGVAVTINQAAGQADPASTSPILFDVVFSEPVTGFTADDVVISGTAGATVASVSGSGANYTVAVRSPMPLSLLTDFNAVPWKADMLATSVDGNTLFNLGNGSGFSQGVNAWDITDRTNPILVGGATVVGPYNPGGQRLIRRDDYLYYMDSAGSLSNLFVVDASDPTAMFVAATFTDAAIPQVSDVVAADGDTLFVRGFSSSTDGLVSIDISTRLAPVVLDSITDPLVTGLSSGIVQDGFLYLTGEGTPTWLLVVDVSNPASMSIVSSSMTDCGVVGAISDDYLFTTLSVGTVKVYDISTPSSPIFVTALTDPNLSGIQSRVSLDGDFIHANATTQQAVITIDISDPTNPAFHGKLVYPNFASDSSVTMRSTLLHDSYLYVTSARSNLPPSNLFVLDTQPVGSGTVIATIPAGMAESTSRVGVLNRASTSTDNVVLWLGPQPTITNVASLQPADAQANFLAKSGDYVYCATNGISIFDVSDPATPVQVGLLGQDSTNYQSGEIRVVGDVAYVRWSGNLSSFDVSDRTAPTFISKVSVTGVGDFVVDGNFAYTLNAGGDAVWVVNVADPASMSVVGTVTDSTALNNASGVTKIGSNLFVIGTTPGNMGIVATVSVAAPSTPTVTNSFTHADLFAGNDIIAVGSNVYASVNADLSGSLTGRVVAIGVSSPTAPSYLSHVDDALLPGTSFSNMSHDSGVIWLNSFNDDAWVGINISNPSSLSVAGSFTDPVVDLPLSVVVSNDVLYGLVGIKGLLMMVDVSTPSAATMITYVQSNRIGFSFAAKGDYLYLTDHMGSAVSQIGTALSTVDASDPTALAFVAFHRSGNTFAFSAVCDGPDDYLLCVNESLNRLSMVDVSDPVNPVVVDTITDATILLNVQQVAWQGNYAYAIGRSLADSDHNNLAVIDISNPAAMSIVGFVTDADLAVAQYSGIVVDGDYVYICGIGLSIVDVSTPTAPIFVTTLTVTNILDDCHRLVKDGDFCYVTNDNPSRLAIVNVSNPAAPVVTGSANPGPGQGPFDLVKIGNFCFVTCREFIRQLSVIDVTEPAFPAETSAIDLSALNELALVNGYLIASRGAVVGTSLETFEIT